MPRTQWNYRIVRDERREPPLSLREVLYDENDDIVKIMDEDATPFGKSVSEIISDIDKMLRACALPILEIPRIVEEAQAIQRERDGDVD